jgi:hypothetical protein
MKLGFQNYAVNITIHNSYIKFNNNKSLQTYDTTKITEFYTKKLSVYPNINSKCQTTALLHISMKDMIIQIKM